MILCRQAAFLLMLSLCVGIPVGADFQSELSDRMERHWIAPEYWSNPMEDWRLHEGRMECLSNASNRNIILLTEEMNDEEGGFEIQVNAGLLEEGNKTGSVGFRVGIQNEMEDYRARLLHGRGIDAGVTTGGQLYIHDKFEELDAKPALEDVLLILRGKTTEETYQLELTLIEHESRDIYGRITSDAFSADDMQGSVAIVNNYFLDNKTFNNIYRNNNAKGPRFWFKDWYVLGEKIDTYEERTFGPILWSMYSLSRGVMKMTAFLPPIGEKDNREVTLQIKQQDEWVTIGKESIDPAARTATFRIANWNDHCDIPYRLVYSLKRAEGSKVYYWKGTVRKDPKEKEDLVVAAFCCQTDFGFPHTRMVNNVAFQDPDLLFFAGDQIYESVGGYGIIRRPADRSILNYLRKFYLFGWAFGDLMRDRPTLCIPDDHDVFQGNIWGDGGKPTTMADHDGGGYAQPPEMVNVVHTTNTSHHPDFYDPTPIEQDISVYYGDMVYGRISFAIIADRMFKSGPKFTVTSWSGRPDHIKDPNFDMSSLDKPGLTLLGDRQLNFLEDWGKDWRGAEMKSVLSQTIFANVATHHGGNLDMFLAADLDSNGWPQSGRDLALEKMRKAFAVHIAGDQHLPSLLQHGIDAFRDASWSFCVPAISVGYQRAWWPDKLDIPVVNRPEHNCPNTGDYYDMLDNLVSVYAVGNPKLPLSKKNREATLHDKSSGYGVIRFHKPSREITFEAWKLLFDAKNPKPEDQFCGWPKTVTMEENDGRKAKAWLPTLEVEGLVNPVVQVINESTGETVYTLRVQGNSFAPKVFEKGFYTLKIGDQKENNKILKGIESIAEKNEETINVSFK